MATADRASPASHGGSDGPDGDRIVTARLELAPLAVSDAEEMVAVLGDEGLYAFTRWTAADAGGAASALRPVGGGPLPRRDPAMAQLDRAAARRRGRGTVQATITAGDRAAEVAWVIAVAWQGQGLAATGELHHGERVWRRETT
jgi:hypothetical protein